MSLWCGSCRSCIYGRYGILYLLVDKIEGQLRLPSKKEDYVPANCAVCEECFNAKQQSNLSKEEALRQPYVYAFSWDIGPAYPEGHFAQWSSIMTDEENYTFFPKSYAHYAWPKAMPIIKNMAISNKQYEDKKRQAS